MSIEFHNKLIKNRKILVLYLIFALAITYFASWLPDFVNVMGMDGARISSVGAFGPLNGMLLGPYMGAAVSFFGIMAHVTTHFFNQKMADTNTFLFFTPLFVMLSSIVAGLIVTKKEKVALVIYSSLIFLWYLFDTGREAYYYPWFHLVVLVLFVIFYKKYNDRVKNVGMHTLILLFFISLLAVLSDHMAGSITALVLFDLPAEIFNSVIFIYPIERIILAIAAALVMFMLAFVLQNILMESDIIDDEIENVKMNAISDYINHDVKKILDKKEKYR